jgi:peptidoglycan/LPS O-acetylase OafA/YrhL
VNSVASSTSVDRPAAHDAHLGRTAYLPALDGLRGMGIPFVLLYHHGLAVFGVRFEGVLPVSLFFTLSGFLITRILWNEHDRRGSISLTTFYSRRIRRLMPAALIVLFAITLIWVFTERSLPFADVFWSLFYGQNIHLVVQGRSYDTLFTERSPLTHMWSLSLEEQYYIVYPVLLIVALRVRRVRRAMPALLALGAIVSWWFAHRWYEIGGIARAYYATEARAGEFLLGAALAAWTLTSPHYDRVMQFLRRRPMQVVSFVVLAAEAWMWMRVGLHTTWMFPWGIALNSVIVCALMAYSAANTGFAPLVNRSLLRWISNLSYSMYLIHWPVFILINSDNTGLASELLFVVRVAVTVGLALVMYLVIEHPVRTGRRWSTATLATVCVGLAGATLAISPLAVSTTRSVLADQQAAEQQVVDVLGAAPVPSDAPTRIDVVGGGDGDVSLPARVLFVGDSQAFVLSAGLSLTWAEQAGVELRSYTKFGCGMTEITPIVYLGTRVDDGFAAADGTQTCQEWRDGLAAVVDSFRPQVVVVAGGLAHLSDHELDGEWRSIGDPVYDEWLTAQFGLFVDVLDAGDVPVLWLTNSLTRLPKPIGVESFVEELPERMSRHNELLRSFDLVDDRVVVADLDAVGAARDGGVLDPTYRPDGAHICLRAAPEVVDWLVEQVVAASNRRLPVDPAPERAVVRQPAACG